MDLLQLERVVATTPSAMTPVVRFWVDEREMRLIAWRGRWCLMAPLVVAGEWRAALPQLAQDAMGRILCDQTILTWDEPSQQLMLWEPLPQGCSAETFRVTLEAFLNARAWWLERLEALAVLQQRSQRVVVQW